MTGASWCCPTLLFPLTAVLLSFWPKPSRHQSVISKVTSSCFLTNRTALCASALVLFVCLHLTFTLTSTALWDFLQVYFSATQEKGIHKFCLDPPCDLIDIQLKKNKKLSNHFKTLMNTTRTITYPETVTN